MTRIAHSEDLPDLAPTIHRQRLVVEGTCEGVITRDMIVTYLQGLSEVAQMVTLLPPVTHRSPLYGLAGWIHWETSGTHFYAWDPGTWSSVPRGFEGPARPSPGDVAVTHSFFSVDVYTCKAFEPETVVAYTEEYFRADQIVAKAF